MPRESEISSSASLQGLAYMTSPSLSVRDRWTSIASIASYVSGSSRILSFFVVMKPFSG